MTHGNCRNDPTKVGGPWAGLSASTVVMLLNLMVRLLTGA